MEKIILSASKKVIPVYLNGIALMSANLNNCNAVITTYADNLDLKFFGLKDKDNNSIFSMVIDGIEYDENSISIFKNSFIK